MIPSASQTIGPFFRPALAREGWNDLTRAHAEGTRILLTGRVLDGNGEPVDDAMLELWQADARGDYGEGIRGFGRACTDTLGAYTFTTIRPGAVREAGGTMSAPHVNLSIFARGLLRRLVTRVYFPDEPANERDPLLAALSERQRATLIASIDAAPAEPIYRFDVHLQGQGETVFLDVGAP